MKTKKIINLHLHINNTNISCNNQNNSIIIGTKANVQFLNPVTIAKNLKKTSRILTSLLTKNGNVLLISNVRYNLFLKVKPSFFSITGKPGTLTNKKIKKIPDIIILLGPLNSIKNKYIIEEAKKLAIPTISLSSIENYSKNILYINPINYKSSNIAQALDFILKYTYISSYTTKLLRFSKKKRNYNLL